MLLLIHEFTKSHMQVLIASVISLHLTKLQCSGEDTLVWMSALKKDPVSKNPLQQICKILSEEQEAYLCLPENGLSLSNMIHRYSPLLRCFSTNQSGLEGTLKLSGQDHLCLNLLKQGHLVYQLKINTQKFEFVVLVEDFSWQYHSP